MVLQSTLIYVCQVYKIVQIYRRTFQNKPSDITCSILTTEEEENKLNTERVHYTRTTNLNIHTVLYIILLGW